MAGHQFCNAAELLRQTWDGWPEANQERLREMARNVWYPIVKDFYPSANGNWDAAMLQKMIAMGVFLDDREMFDRAVNYYLHGEGNAALGNYFDVPYEPYRSYEGRCVYKQISDDSRGRLRTMYKKVFNHYHNRLDLPAEFTRQAVITIRDRVTTRSARRRSDGGSSSLPWDTLMFAKE